MEALAVLRLTPPPGRSNHHNNNNNNAAEPSPPSSPRHAFAMEEVEEAPLGEVRAAIPFLWELTPGTPKDDFEMPETAGSEHQEDDSDRSLEFSSDGARPVSPPHEILSKRHGVPLRLPPRLQHLQTSSGDGSSNSRAMLCGFMRTLEEEVTVLGMQERKQRIRPLSPLRFLSAERSNETSFSHDSVSSSFSSSSSGNETSPQAQWDSSPDAQRNEGRTLNDLVPDMVVASKESAQDMAKPRIVESGRELLKKLHPDAAELKVDVVPKPSPRPPARSRPSSSPSAEMHFRSSRREHLGRVLFANRFGILGSCLGIPPQTP